MLLILHLLGDYVLQSHIMATRKTTETKWALIHAFFYSLPFVIALPLSFWQWLVIFGTHAVIDRFRLASYWCKWWGVGLPGIWQGIAREIDFYLHIRWSHEPWHEAKSFQERPFEAPPPFLGVWLMIIVDNTMHLVLNSLAIYLLPMADRASLFSTVL